MHFKQHRKAKKQKRNVNLSKPSDSIVLEPLRLIMGKDNGQGQSTAWAHRLILGQTARSVQQ